MIDWKSGDEECGAVGQKKFSDRGSDFGVCSVGMARPISDFENIEAVMAISNFLSKSLKVGSVDVVGCGAWSCGRYIEEGKGEE